MGEKTWARELWPEHLSMGREGRAQGYCAYQVTGQSDPRDRSLPFTFEITSCPWKTRAAPVPSMCWEAGDSVCAIGSIGDTFELGCGLTSQLCSVLREPTVKLASETITSVLAEECWEAGVLPLVLKPESWGEWAFSGGSSMWLPYIQGHRAF